MTDPSNVSQLPSGAQSGRTESPGFDPFYALSVPSIDDTVNLASAILRSTDRETLALLASDEAQLGLFDLFARAVGNPESKNEIMLVFSDIWKHDVDVTEPHEDWDYEPDPKAVEKGQKLSREEMWRTMARSTRRRMVKRVTLGKIPYWGWYEFYKAFTATVDVSDFLGSVQGFVKARSGEPTTDSPNATDTPTEG